MYVNLEIFITVILATMAVMLSTYAALLWLIVRESQKTKASILTLKQSISELVRPAETHGSQRPATSPSPVRARPTSYLESVPLRTSGGEAANAASSSEAVENPDLPVCSAGGGETAARSQGLTNSGPLEDDSGYVLVDEVVTMTNAAYKKSVRKV